MARLACVDLPALPLQILLRQEPEWKGLPVAVVDRDRPHGRLLWVNEAARRLEIRPGTRYSAALSLCGKLRAGEVCDARIDRECRRLIERLRDFSPTVEPSQDEVGVFWLDTSGFSRLYPSLAGWGRLVRVTIEELGFGDVSIAIGFTKFGSYAVARARQGVTVLPSACEERRAAAGVSLERLELSPSVLKTLRKLRVLTVGDYATLPAEGLQKRFGKEAYELYRRARGDLADPLHGVTWEPPLKRRLHFDHAERDLHRLLTFIDEALEELLAMACVRDRALESVSIELGFENRQRHGEHLRPAAPTTDARQLSELVRLRLQSVTFPDGVTDLLLEARAVGRRRQQLDLFEERPRRDLEAAQRALARLRAEFGGRAVARVVCRDGHLPEARFEWREVGQITPGEPSGHAPGRLVRRIYQPPVSLPARPRHEPDGWMLQGLQQGPVTRVTGPFIISGGWWRRALHREYYFAETLRGEILWVYYDRGRRRWAIHGRVE